ncbi:unnamed protein product [Gadus morhua 'NCC']
MAENVDLTFSFKWSKEHTAQLIKLRGENDELFTGVKHSASVAWGTILEKIGLQGYVTPLQAKKKWDNLKKIYKVCTGHFKYTLFVLTMQVNKHFC